jgi:hypothetical protein
VPNGFVLDLPSASQNNKQSLHVESGDSDSDSDSPDSDHLLQCEKGKTSTRLSPVHTGFVLDHPSSQKNKQSHLLQ